MISGLHVGIVNSNSDFFLETLKPKSIKIFMTSLSFILKPAIFSNKEILTLNDAYKEIFKTENLHQNLSKLNVK